MLYHKTVSLFNSTLFMSHDVYAEKASNVLKLDMDHFIINCAMMIHGRLCIDITIILTVNVHSYSIMCICMAFLTGIIP